MIAILGANGRTGRAAAAALRAAGREPRLVTRSSADLGDEDALSAALDGVKSLYAILPDDLRNDAFHDTRRRTAATVARAAHRARVEHVVLCSALTAVDRVGFGRDLAFFESALVETGAVVTTLRAAYFQENVLATLPLAKRDGIHPWFFPVSARVPMVASADVGEAAARALIEGPSGRRNETVAVLGPEYGGGDVAAELARVALRDVGVVVVPSAAHESTFREWMSVEAARAMADTLAWLAGPRSSAGTDRIVRGRRALAEVLR